jgi:hypothetical protein
MNYMHHGKGLHLQLTFKRPLNAGREGGYRDSAGFHHHPVDLSVPPLPVEAAAS